MQTIQRFLVGQSSWLFLVEVLYRAAIIYVVLLLAMRLMGKRMAAQLETSELAVILLLGAAISAPVQVAKQGMLPALVVLATVAALQRGFSYFSLKSRRFLVTAYGRVDMLVCDGRFVMERMEANKLSRDMLISELRSKGVRQLGQLRRVYIEPTGSLSLIYCKSPRPGLSLAPDNDDSAWYSQQPGQQHVCWTCGDLLPESPGEDACRHCGERRRCLAVLS